MSKWFTNLKEQMMEIDRLSKDEPKKPYGHGSQEELSNTYKKYLLSEGIPDKNPNLPSSTYNRSKFTLWDMVLRFCQNKKVKYILDIASFSGQFPYLCNLNGLNGFGIDATVPTFAKKKDFIVELGVFNLVEYFSKEENKFPKFDVITCFNCPDLAFGYDDEFLEKFKNLIFNSSCKYLIWVCNNNGEIKQHSNHSEIKGLKLLKHLSFSNARHHAIYKVEK